MNLYVKILKYVKNIYIRLEAVYTGVSRLYRKRKYPGLLQ